MNLSIFSLIAQNGAINMGKGTIESMPIFQGDRGMFLHQNIRYPETAIRDSIGGTVYVDFSVEEDGQTTGHTIVRGVREDIDNEALRVAKLIRFQKPAMNKGKPVRLPDYLLPIRFILPYNKNKVSQQQFSIIFYDEQDSCFCLNNRFVARDAFEEELLGVPEHLVTGEHHPLELIIQNIQRIILKEMGHIHLPQQLLAMKIIVDKTGKVRCGVTLRGHNEDAFRQIFNLLQEEKYIPAKDRGNPIMWYFHFMIYF